MGFEEVYKMRPESLLGKSFECECGKVHTVPTKSVLYSDDIFENIPDIIRDIFPAERITIIADVRTFEVAGRKVESFLKRAGILVKRMIIPDPSPDKTPVCDDKTHQKMLDELEPTDLILGVGSGVVNDLSKWVSFDRSIPYIIFATAPSMNGYTAANIAAIVNGLKTIIYAKPPLGVLASPEIIVNAPSELISAGLGDVLAKPVSTADWIMNNFLFDEYFCEFCTKLISEIEPIYFDNPEGIKSRDPEAIKALFDALIYSGIAMTIAGTSAPASGGEHLLSHTLDMLSLVDGKKHDLHGKQVGLGTIFAAGLYERIFAIDSAKLKFPENTVREEFWKKLTRVVRKEYEQKEEKMEIVREKLSVPDNWNQLMGKLQAAYRSPYSIRDCLKRAGAAYRIDDLVVPEERVRLAVLHMHEIRSRFTIVDLARMVDILPQQADGLISELLK